MSSFSPDRLRNLCIIAHVDHGKTTLVDFLLSQSSTFRRTEAESADRVMDSDDQERERGITISAKNAAIVLPDEKGEIKVNIVDTPGHADFGGEVERIMAMVDGGILLVDAVEGPLPQTRFVLQKAIKKNLKLVLCINKVDRPELVGSNLIDACINQVFDLFVELGATDEQCDFPIVYACAKLGWCTTNIEEIPTLIQDASKGSLKPLFDLIKKLPPPKDLTNDPFSLLVSNLSYSDYVGSLAVGQVFAGKVKVQDSLERIGVDEKDNPVRQKFIVTKIFRYEGMKPVESEELTCGDIGLLSGCPDFAIGDTLTVVGGKAHERIVVEKPTVKMIFSINNTPNSGREGKAIQSRELKDRLIKETQRNVALKLLEADSADQIFVLGRGELQFSVLIENMRREGLEFMVGKPIVIYQQSEGQRQEPFERLTIETPEGYAGDVSNLYLQRKGQLLGFEPVENVNASEGRVKLTIEIPTRGYLGTHSRFKTLTRGTGIISAQSIGYREYQGDIPHRTSGSLIADRSGKTTAYALAMAQERGVLFVGEGVDVYEGMIVGECSRDHDLNINVCRPKKLTNVRSTSSDGITMLAGLKLMSLEQYLEWIDEDEWIEVTPKNIRVRKKILACGQRSVKREDRIR